MSRKTVSGLALSALLMLSAGVPAAMAQEPPKLAGEPSMLNLVHVWNHQTTGTPADGHASDLEFYTTTVPLRDYTTGEKILDEFGNEIPVEKDFAVMGSYTGGAWVYDITDPAAPQFVINITCNQSQNDVQLKKFGDRWILALAKDQTGNPCVTTKLFGTPGAAGIAVFDVTDPYEYVRKYSFRTTGGAHNFTFHPTKPYGWVSTGDLPGGMNHIPIINFTDVDNPTLAGDIPVEGGPHDIAFSDDGTRAYVASENNYRIYDTNNPAAPVLIGLQRPNAGTYAHGFDPTPDKQMAVATNESLALGGFFVGGSAVCPGEGLTFFDLSTESAPVPVGEFLAPVVGNPSSSRACTGHVGQIAPNGNVLVTGWYAGGARVVDFSNPSVPVEVGHAVMPNAEVWTANIYKGPYLYTADQRRGFDVFKWTAGPVAPWEPSGTSPAQATPDDPTPIAPEENVLPAAADPGPANDFAEGLVPTHTDIPGLADNLSSTTIGAGDCQLEVSAPFKNAGSAVGSGAFSCNTSYPVVTIRVCLDSSNLGQWVQMKCFARAAKDGSSISAGSIGVCEPGTWKYRTRAVGIALDSATNSVKAVARSIEAAKIRCMVA